EAASLLDRASALAPDNTRIATLRAYANLQLGRLTDAGLAGKAALEAGERSPLLMATLAQVHQNLGHPDLAAEFGRLAAREVPVVRPESEVALLALPLTRDIADTPA